MVHQPQVRPIYEHQIATVSRELITSLEIGDKDRQAGIDGMTTAVHDGRVGKDYTDQTKQQEIEWHLVSHARRMRRNGAQHSQVIIGQVLDHAWIDRRAENVDTCQMAVAPEGQFASGSDV